MRHQPTAGLAIALSQQAPAVLQVHRKISGSRWRRYTTLGTLIVRFGGSAAHGCARRDLMSTARRRASDAAAERTKIGADVQYSRLEGRRQGARVVVSARLDDKRAPRVARRKRRSPRSPSRRRSPFKCERQRRGARHSSSARYFARSRYQTPAPLPG